MIRTNVVNLKSIDAVAYREKMGGATPRIVILRYDSKQPGIAEISRTSGDPIIAKNTPCKLFPKKAFKEAMELTHGMSYRNQKAVKLEKHEVVDKKKDKKKEKVEEEIFIDTVAFNKIQKKYTDKKGNFSYDLLNKDLIKFANSSSKVKELLEEGKTVKAVSKYIVEHKFRTVGKNPNLTSKQINAMVELLDEQSPKGVLKELNDYLRLKVGKNKKR